MLDIINSAIEAHGGLDRWNRVSDISATLNPGGLALELRGQAAFARQPTRMTIDPRLQRVAFDPFVTPGQVGLYSPFRTAIETAGGVVIEGLDNPRQSFQAVGTPWTATQLVYFAGYAMWTYNTLPFSLLTEGVECDEIEPWIEGDQVWRAVRVRFPPSYVTHTAEQVLYFGADGLMRRQDYVVDIAPGGMAAHYLFDHEDIDGLVFATRRRIYPRGADGRPDRQTVLMSADLSDFAITYQEPVADGDWCVDTCD